MTYDARKLSPTLPPVPFFATAQQSAARAEDAVGGKQNMVALLKALVKPIGLQPTVQYMADGGDISFDTPPEWYAQQAASVLDAAINAPDSWESPQNVASGVSTVNAQPFVNPAGAAPAPGVQAAPAPGYSAPMAAPVTSANVVPNPYQQLTMTTPQYTQPYQAPPEPTAPSALSRLWATVSKAPAAVPVPAPMQTVGNAVADAASSVGNTAVDAASLVGQKLLNNPFTRTNAADLAGAAFDGNPDTTMSDVFNYQQNGGPRPETGLGNGPLANLARVATSPITYAAPVDKLSGLIPLGSSLAGSAAGEYIAPKIGVSPTIGNIAGGILGPPAVATGLGLTKGLASLALKRPVSALAPEGTPSGLTGEVPATPSGAPASGASAATETPVSKLATAIKNAGKATPEQQRIFAEERAQRTAAGASALEGGTGASAFQSAKGALSGEFRRPTFETPVITPEETNGLIETIRTHPGLLFYQKINAEQALQDLFTGRIPQPSQMTALKAAFPEGGDQLVQALLDKRSLGQKAFSELVGAMGLPQTFQASFDYSAPGRQGAILGWSHPKQWADAWAPMVRASASESGAAEAMRSVERNPWFSITAGENAGLGFADVGGHIYDVSKYTPGIERAGGFAGLNESYVSRLAQKFPGIAQSERAFSTFLNKLGVDVYAQEADKMWQAGVREPDQYRALAAVINHARGYGDFSVGSIGAGVNTFYSGRNLVARFQVLLDPIMQPGSLLSPSARQLAAKNIAGMIAGDLTFLGTIAGLTSLGGINSTFEADPRSTDFGKLRMGNTRIDPWGGFLPIVRVAARAATGETKSAAGDIYPADVRRELIGFFRNKTAPIPSLVIDLLAGENAVGEKVDLSPKGLADRFLPFIYGDVRDAAKLSGTKEAAVAGPLGLFGVGTMTYQTASQKRDVDVLSAIKNGETYTNAAGQQVPFPGEYTDANGKQQQVRSFNDLKAADPLAADAFGKAHPDVTAAAQSKQSDTTQRIHTIQDEFTARQEQRDVSLLSTNPAQWRKESGDDNARVQAAIEERANDYGTYDRKPQTLLDAANQKYHEAIVAATNDRNTVDWDKVDRAVAQMSPQEQQLLFANRLAGETPARQQYIKDLSKLEDYFSQRDQAWAKLQASNPTFQQYASLDDFTNAKVQEVLAKNPGYGRQQVESLVKGSLNVYTQNASLAGAQYLAQHPELVALLDKYGFGYPSIVAPLVNVGGAGR